MTPPMDEGIIQELGMQCMESGLPAAERLWSELSWAYENGNERERDELRRLTEEAFATQTAMIGFIAEMRERRA